uniref:Uncharacterized protein n=1 Tax=Onchocerca volvulus TaxID=6282 RepID=A0A8R1TMR3_ONCVO
MSSMQQSSRCHLSTLRKLTVITWMAQMPSLFYHLMLIFAAILRMFCMCVLVRALNRTTNRWPAAATAVAVVTAAAADWYYGGVL